MSKIDELVQGFMSDDIATTSELKLRDENIQKKHKIKRLTRLKKEPKKKAKLLIATEVAIPFNPFTGKEDDKYNRNQKFRPLKSQETMMKAIKKIANENPESKEVFMSKSGVADWDTSDYTVITDADRKVLNRYRVPRVFTLPVCRVNIPVFTGNAFGKEYLLRVKRDPITEQVIGEMPLPLMINKLMNDRAYEQQKKLEKDIKDGVEVLNDKDKAKKMKDIRDNEVLVTGDYPLNFIMAMEIPLNGQSEVTDKAKLSDLTYQDMFKQMKLVKCGKEMSITLDKFTSGDYTKLDKYDNFWEIDMNCSDDEDPKDLGSNTRYEKAMEPIIEHKDFKSLSDSFAGFFDDSDDLEKVFMSSSFVSKLTPELESNLLDAVSNLMSLDDSCMTDAVVKANADIITLLFDAEGDAKIAEAEVGLGDEGELDEEASAKAGKEFNIKNILSDDESTLENEDTEAEIEIEI